MSMLIIGDLHLSDNPRDLYRDHFMRDLPAIVEKQGVRDVIVLGDLTEEKDRHSAQLTNMVVNHMYQLSRRARVHIIPGNHDYVDEEQPFFEFLGLYPGISYYSKPTDVTLQGMQCMFLPHTHDYKRDWQKIDWDRYHYVFAHQTFKGANIGHGREADNGIPHIFCEGPVIISGDVHIPQRIDNLYYVGAPYTIDFGDDYKGRLLLLATKDKLISIPVDCAQKRLITITEMKDFKDRTVRAGDVIKVKVMDDVFESFPECSEYVRKWANENGCVLHAFQMYQADVLIADEPHQRIESRDDETILEEFATQRGINEKTLATGQRILRKT